MASTTTNGGQPRKSMLVPAVATDLRKNLRGFDHSVSEKWHCMGPPKHYGPVEPGEYSKVAPHCKAITEELTPFMEEYFWRVDNSSQREVFEAMFTPHAMYYNNGLKQITFGSADAHQIDTRMPFHPWLIHQIDRMAILPPHDGDPNAPVLVHVLGSSWNGLKKTEDKAEQEKDEEAKINCPFSETFEVIKWKGEWKINRVILILHYDLATMMTKYGIKGSI
ncbi:hypothetical protein AYO21_03419 [Fonsecaea monophora]|uniref:SnoaL-like domain-containing protein n=1 Tax=Fonsecaea monophora TaxID=254056 RepID=A0A177FEQ4_9EURO|nr:hypothetical protein AYO21_03419 [Fonsecaea monophora]KAH0843128.1 hypothetical protein FOPE_08325 [Fonsecaea pedrosoi]OAG42251.1 hypothetical protein AYO21_03419 [Fonsecaea monophora]